MEGRLDKMKRLHAHINSKDPLRAFVAKGSEEELHRMQEENTEHLFKLCQKYDLRYILVHDLEICGCEGKKTQDTGFMGFPIIWQIVDDLGLRRSCGNGDQYQTNECGIFFTKETYGAWEVDTRRKLSEEETEEKKFRRVVSRRK